MREPKGNRMNQDDANELAALGPRTLQTLVLIAKGCSTREIMGLMKIGRYGVHTNRRRILKKLGVNMHAACAMAGRAELT